jgi:CubicO group peptidase (beta-lactamase class C family)
MPIAEVWPEFAATHADKSKITVRHVLGHVSGMQHMPMGIGMTEFCNWDAMCDAIAKQKPAHEPGIKREYHAITYGFLMGEVARRVDGRSFPQLLHDEIAQPLGLEDELFMGIPTTVENRVATLMHIFPDGEPVVDDTIPQAIPGWTQPLYRMMNQSDARESCSPGSGGIMSAHAIARHYASLLPGGVDGVQLYDDERLAIATTEQFPDMVDGNRFALGYVHNPVTCADGSTRIQFGHGGHGGAQGYADMTYGLAVGFTHNLFGPNHQGDLITTTLRQALDLPV